MCCIAMGLAYRVVAGIDVDRYRHTHMGRF